MLSWQPIASCVSSQPTTVSLIFDLPCVLSRKVASLEFLRGRPSVVPLLDYGVTTSVSGMRQWVLVFPRYAGSMREWRISWAGRGLDTHDLPMYLSLFVQVSIVVWGFKRVLTDSVKVAQLPCVASVTPWIKQRCALWPGDSA